ncbi:MAG: amidohydrolase family protein [Halopseudomonas aestusnigri]
MFRTLSGRSPRISLPKGAVDCHMHIYDGINFMAPADSQGLPEDAFIAHYEQVQRWLGFERVVIVQSNGYRFDNSCTLHALDHFGENARAIVTIKPEISDAEIENLSKRGVRGARIMDIWGGSVPLKDMLAVNDRVHPFDWSLIVQFDGCEIVEHSHVLEKIQGNYVIDHTGKFLNPVTVDSAEFKALLKLIDRGNCYIKVSAFYETSNAGAPDYSDVGSLAKALIDYAPDRILWATNWPHLMARDAQSYPDDVYMLDLVNDWAGSDEVRRKIFADNPSRLYGF